MDEIVLTIDHSTARAVLRTLFGLGEHFAAGAPLPAMDDPSNPDVQRVADFMTMLNRALGGSGRMV